MSRIRTLGALALAIAAVSFAQDTVTIKRELKAGAKDIYKVVTETKTLMDIPSMGEQEMIMKSTMNYALTTGEVKDDSAEVGLTISDIQAKIEGSMADMMQGMPEMPKEMKFKGTLDARNRLSNVKLDGKLDMMAMMMANTTSTMNMFVEYPGGPVKIGDSWEVVVPKNPMLGNEDTKFKATLVGEKDGKWQIKMSGELKLKSDLSEMMKGQDPTGTGLDMQMVMTGTMKMESEALVNKTTGKTVEMTTALDSATTMDIVNMGIKSDQKAKGTIKMTLQ